LYLPKRLPSRMTDEQYQNLIDQIIKRHHLKDPYPIQYVYWLQSLAQGTWGYSPVLQDDVLTALLQRTPATAELTLYSIFLFLPLGLISGVAASWREGKAVDKGFRLIAFISTSIPPFILALLLISIFYVALRWFPPERLSLIFSLNLKQDGFRYYTGLLTIDGLLNHRLDVTIDALRHLVLPVITLSLFHWATLGRVTRAAMSDEFTKEYALAARARGFTHNRVIWRHVLRNSLTPALTSSLLSAATLVTGVFVVEIIFAFHGVSDLIVRGLGAIPDAPAALGFSVYSVIMVLLLMLFLDLIQAAVDPRYREGVVLS
jgi:ABC-type dipeptide/oligopeptide/nickel transport system permease component